MSSTLERLWDCIIEVHRDPTRWEYADEVMDALGEVPRGTPAFIKRLNGYLKDCDVSNRVPMIGELKGDGHDHSSAHQAQAKALGLAMNRLFEAIHEEPEKASLVVPPEYFQRREMDRLSAMRESFEAEAREMYGDATSIGVGDYEPPTWDDTHEALLESPGLLDMLIQWGDAQVKDMPDVWMAVWLGLASVHAPPIRQGAQVHHPQCDILLIGEISTAKSGILGLVSDVTPRGLFKTNFTPVAFTGRIDKEGDFQPGIAYRANGGVLCVDELDKLLIRYPILDGLIRTAQTEHRVQHSTALGEVDYQAAFGLFAGANPKGDVFSDAAIRAQVPFAEGLLSRYAFIKPLAYTPDKVNAIADYMGDTWFSDEPPKGTLSVDKIRSTLAALWHRLKDVVSVQVDRDLRVALVSHFKERQDSIAGVPLLTTRDLESAFKWLNASASLHVAQRDVQDGAIVATAQDLDIALTMLDCTVSVRQVLLASSRKAVAMSPLEIAASTLGRELALGELSRIDAVNILMERHTVSSATAYRWLDDLAHRGVITINGSRNSTIAATPS